MSNVIDMKTRKPIPVPESDYVTCPHCRAVVDRRGWKLKSFTCWGPDRHVEGWPNIKDTDTMGARYVSERVAD